MFSVGLGLWARVCVRRTYREAVLKMDRTTCVSNTISASPPLVSHYVELSKGTSDFWRVVFHVESEVAFILDQLLYLQEKCVDTLTPLRRHSDHSRAANVEHGNENVTNDDQLLALEAAVDAVLSRIECSERGNPGRVPFVSRSSVAQALDTALSLPMVLNSTRALNQSANVVRALVGSSRPSAIHSARPSAVRSPACPFTAAAQFSSTLDVLEQQIALLENQLCAVTSGNIDCVP